MILITLQPQVKFPDIPLLGAALKPLTAVASGWEGTALDKPGKVEPVYRI